MRATVVGDGNWLWAVTDDVGSIVGIIENPEFELVPVETSGPGK